MASAGEKLFPLEEESFGIFSAAFSLAAIWERGFLVRPSVHALIRRQLTSFFVPDAREWAEYKMRRLLSLTDSPQKKGRQRSGHWWRRLSGNSPLFPFLLLEKHRETSLTVGGGYPFN